MLRHGAARGAVLQAVRFPPLRADGRGQYLLRGGVALRNADARLQGLQHLAVSILFDALRQGGGLCGSAVKEVFDVGGVGLAAEGGAELPGDGGAGAVVVQAFGTLPLCADGGGQGFLRDVVVLRGGDAGVQGLQHLAVSGLLDALRQGGSLRGGAVKEVFDDGGVGLAAEGGADFLRDSGTGGGVVQGVRFPPLRADAGGERFLRGVVVFGGGDARIQGLQHAAVSGLLDALRQFAYLRGGAVEDVFHGRGVGFVAERGAELSGDGGTGGGVVQGVRFPPLCADDGGERFLRGTVALRGGNARAEGVQHRAVGFLPHALRQDGGFDGHVGDGLARSLPALCQPDAGGAVGCAAFARREVDGAAVFRHCPACGAVGGEARCRPARCGGLSAPLRHFFGNTFEDGFDGGAVGFVLAAERGDDALRHGVAGGVVLQALFLPVGADAGGQRVLRFGTLRVADVAAQGVQHVVVVVRADAGRDFPRLLGGAVQDGFDQGAIFLAVTAEDGSHLLGDGGTDGAVLQTVLVLPLIANGGSQHFLYVGAGGVTEAGAQGFHHDAVGILTHPFRQHTRHTVRHGFQHGIEHSFVGHAFFQQRGFQLTDDGITCLAFGIDALLQPLATDGIGQYRLHIFVRPSGEATTQGGEHTVIGLL